MEKKIDLTSIDLQKFDPKQAKELYASLSEEELAEIASGTHKSNGHVCGDYGGFLSPENVSYDFLVGTRVQVRHGHQIWRSWSATIIGRKTKYEFVPGVDWRYVPYYKVHFDGYNDSYDDRVQQGLLYSEPPRRRTAPPGKFCA